MQYARLALGAFGALALAACADAPTSLTAAHAPVHLDAAPAASSTYLVRFTRTAIPAAFAGRVADLGGSVKFSHAGAGIAAVTGLTADAAAQLGQLDGVAEVLQDATVSLSQPGPGGMTTASLDSLGVTDQATSQTNPAAASGFAYQWNMRQIGAPDAWKAGKLGDAGVTVAIIDTGLDYDIPDLNGLVDLSRSTSLVDGDDAITATYFSGRNRVSDYNGHGTNVATQVSSKGRFFAGVTSRTTLIGVKVLGADGSGSFAAIMNGILWAADHGADVANMSLGGGFAKAGNGRFVATVNRVLAYAGQQGMLTVVSAGNDAANLDANGNEFASYCSATHVVCVSSTGPASPSDSYDSPAFYTNFGRSSVDVAAPGGNADLANGFPVQAWPWGKATASWVYSYCSKTTLAFGPTGSPSLTFCANGRSARGYLGTSQAAPHVSGLAALLVAGSGHGRPAQIKQAIKQSAVDLGQPGTDPYYGAGRISVTRALGL